MVKACVADVRYFMTSANLVLPCFFATVTLFSTRHQRDANSSGEAAAIACESTQHTYQAKVTRVFRVVRAERWDMLGQGV